MLPELTVRLKNEWVSLFPQYKIPAEINYLGIPGSVEGGVTTFLGFGDRDSEPSFAVKIHRDLNARDAALKEYQNLEFIHSLGTGLSDTVPKVLMVENISGIWYLVQTIKEGRPMQVRMLPNGSPEIEQAGENFKHIVEWLEALNHDTLTQDPGTIATVKNSTINDIELFIRSFDLSELEMEYVKRIAEQLDPLFKSGVVLSHGDLCRQNILVQNIGGGLVLNVIDWSNSRRAEFQLYDIFNFLSTYYLQLRKQTGLDEIVCAFRESFFSESNYGALVRRTISGFAKGKYSDHEIVELGFGVFLVINCVKEADSIAYSLKNGGGSRFNLMLAKFEDLDYSLAGRGQLWIKYFKEFVKQRKRFIMEF